MNNRELNKAVAEIIKQPGERWSERVRNWAEDLPACMRDLWPWLKENSEVPPSLNAPSPHLAPASCYYASIESGELRLQVATGATEALAICHAVLAVAEKLKEQADVRK